MIQIDTEPSQPEKDAAIVYRSVLPAAAKDKKGVYTQVLKVANIPGTNTWRDEYASPLGYGYLDFCEVIKGKDVWRNYTHHGPETWLDDNAGKWMQGTPDV